MASIVLLILQGVLSNFREFRPVGPIRRPPTHNLIAEQRKLLKLMVMMVVMTTLMIMMMMRIMLMVMRDKSEQNSNRMDVYMLAYV